MGHRNAWPSATIQLPVHSGWVEPAWSIVMVGPAPPNCHPGHQGGWWPSDATMTLPMVTGPLVTTALPTATGPYATTSSPTATALWSPRRHPWQQAPCCHSATHSGRLSFHCDITCRDRPSYHHEVAQGAGPCAITASPTLAGPQVTPLHMGTGPCAIVTLPTVAGARVTTAAPIVTGPHTTAPVAGPHITTM